MDPKPIIASRTIWLAVALVIAGGVLEALADVPSVPSWVLSILGAVVAGLRLVTTGPVDVAGEVDRDAP